MVRKGIETGILRAVRDYLRFEGFFVIRNQQGLGCHLGNSDLLAIRNGKVFWIEVKTPTGVLSDYQKRFKDDITKHGGEYLVVRSVDDVIMYLKETGEACSCLIM